MVPALKVGSRRTSRVVRGLKRKAYRVRKVARSWRSQKKNLRPLAEKIIASEVIWQRRELEKKMKGEWENSIGKIKGEIMRQQHILQRGSETERVSAHSVLRNLERRLGELEKSKPKRSNKPIRVSFNGKPGERMQNNITVFSFQLASKRIGLFDAVKKRILKEKLREKPSLADFKVFAEKNANLSEARAHMLWGHFNEMRTDLETEVSKALKEVISR